MKLFYVISATILLFSGCENLLRDQPISNPPEFEYLIEDLSTELNLNTEQRSTARLSLERGRNFHPDPAVLWDLAATLQKELTQQQKDSLFLKISNFNLEIIIEENDHHHGRAKYFYRMNEFLLSLMPDSQKVIYENLLDTKENLVDQFILGYHNNSDIIEMRLGITSVMEWFRAEMDILLTAEQEEAISNKKEEIESNWKQGRRGRGKFYKNSGEIEIAMHNALSLSIDQITELENISLGTKNLLDELKDDYINGISNLSAENFRSEIVIFLSEARISRDLIFTEDQKEIIEIHRALIIRFMKYTRWGQG